MAKKPPEKKTEPPKKKKPKARGPTKVQLTKQLAEARAEIERLRGPAPVRVGPSVPLPKSGRLTKAAVRQHLLRAREG